MRPIATGVARSVVCLSVSVLVTLMQKRLNRSRCRLGPTQVDPRNHVLDGRRELSTGKGNFGEWSSPLKGSGSLCCGVRSKRDHSVLNNDTTAECNAPVWSVSHCIVPREKSATPTMRPFFDLLFQTIIQNRGGRKCPLNVSSEKATNRRQR